MKTICKITTRPFNVRLLPCKDSLRISLWKPDKLLTSLCFGLWNFHKFFLSYSVTLTLFENAKTFFPHIFFAALSLPDEQDKKQILYQPNHTSA